jgi:hypothetical protein
MCVFSRIHVPIIDDHRTWIFSILFGLKGILTMGNARHISVGADRLQETAENPREIDRKPVAWIAWQSAEKPAVAVIFPGSPETAKKM